MMLLMIMMAMMRMMVMILTMMMTMTALSAWRTEIERAQTFPTLPPSSLHTGVHTAQTAQNAHDCIALGCACNALFSHLIQLRATHSVQVHPPTFLHRVNCSSRFFFNAQCAHACECIATNACTSYGTYKEALLAMITHSLSR